MNKVGKLHLNEIVEEAQNFQRENFSKINSVKNFAVLITVLLALYTMCVFIVPHLLTFLASNRDDSAVVAGVFLNLFMGTVYVAFPVFGLLLVLGWRKFSVLTKEYAKNIKELVVPLLMEQSFKNVDYKIDNPSLPVSMELFDMILPKYEKRSSQDFVCAKYGDVSVKMCDNIMTKETANGTVLVFSGLLAVFEMNKRFGCDAYILPKKQERIPGLLKIQPESKDFGYVFDVFTGDSTEIKNILTPVFMESLMKFNSLFHKGTLRCVFRGSKLNLAIPTEKNNFEAMKSYDKAVNVKDLEEVSLHIQELLKIIDLLNSNPRAWAED